MPFLCHFRRAVELTDRLPYGEITQYLAAWRDHADQAYATLAYFDGAVLGRLATAPTLFSVALMDAVCPASTVFAAYHAYGADAAEPVSDKEIRVYGAQRARGRRAVPDRRSAGLVRRSVRRPRRLDLR